MQMLRMFEGLISACV